MSGTSLISELRSILLSGNYASQQLNSLSLLISSLERSVTGKDPTDPIIGIASDRTLSDDESVVLVDATTTDVTVTLPAPSATLSITAGTSRVIFVKRIDSSANTVTVSASSGTIDGAASSNLTVLSGVVLVSDGDDWHILANTGSGGGGSGDVVGPASATDNAIARFNGATGKLIQNSPVTVGDAGELAGISHMDLGTGALAAHTEGRIDYDPTERTLVVYNDDANVTHQLGQEMLIRVYNGTGATIPDGSAVYDAGVQIESGIGRPSVALAQANAAVTSDVIGIVTADIANGSYGWVTSAGFVNDLDLTAYSRGDRLFLSETVAGGFQTAFPAIGNTPIQVGYVAQAGANGRLLVVLQVALITDHGQLAGRGDDDHTQYLLADGTRAMSGALDMGAFAITNVGAVDGRDVSADGAKLDGIEVGATADQIASEVPFTPDGDISATDTQAAVVEVRNDTDTKLAAKVEIGGQIGGTISSPDIRGLRETGGPTLLTLGAVADGEYLVRSGSTIIGGTPAGGSSLTIDTLEGFTTGNRYDADSNGYAGVATGFFFGALVEVRSLNSSGGQAIWNNVNFGVDGWGLGIESNGRFQAYFIDSAGTQVASTAAASDPLNDSPGTFISSKNFLLLGQVVQNGTNNDVYLWINGQKLPVGAGANPYAPVTDAAQIGAGPFGNVAAETGVGGTLYYEGTLTDNQILDWYHACYDAKDIVTNGIGMTIFSVKQGSPGATWTKSAGTGPDLTRTGSLTTVNRNIALWG